MRRWVEVGGLCIVVRVLRQLHLVVTMMMMVGDSNDGGGGGGSIGGFVRFPVPLVSWGT